MTASETGREIPADVRALAVSLVTMMPSRSPFKFEVENAIMAGIMADRATRIASLEAERARTVEAERVIGKLMGLITNVEWWVSNGCSETAREAIKTAREDGWSKMGWRPYLEAKGRALASEKGGQADG